MYNRNWTQPRSLSIDQENNYRDITFHIPGNCFNKRPDQVIELKEFSSICTSS